MLSYLTNEFIKTNFQFNSVGQILFIQKIKELLNNNSGVSYSYKIHNAYSILLELKSVIKDLEYGRTNGFILEEVRKEANEIVKKDLVMPAKQNALYGTVCDEIRKGLSIDKNNQSINATDMDKVHSMYSAICNLENAYEIMDYLNDTVDMLKSAIQSDECEKIIDLTECLVSSIIITKRSISSVYTNVGYFFERSGKAFDDCWNQWVGNLLRIDAKYKCYFKIEDKYKEKVTETITGVEVKIMHPTENGSSLIEDENTYWEVDIKAPANDHVSIVEKAFRVYKKEMGIVEFATAKVDKLDDRVIVYDEHFNKFFDLEQKTIAKNLDYKPYNQYHRNIDRVVRLFVDNLSNEIDKNKVVNAIINTCNFEGEGKTYNFLLLWSSLEALFRSNQYPTAITAIKDVVPNILSHRYIYYRLYDFLKDCNNIGLNYQYQGNNVVTENPNTEQIVLLFNILRDQSEKDVFLQACKNSYELLYYRGIELERILMNAKNMRQKIEKHRQILGYQLQRMYRIRNKFVHHSLVDENIDVLCKHIRVYMWEAIREMSYVADNRKINTLEELYAYFRMNNMMMQKMLLNANSPIDAKNISNGYL